MAIKDIDSFDNEKAFVGSADMVSTQTKSKGGRPKKDANDKANHQVFINLTKEQKNKLESNAAEFALPVSTYVKMVLKRSGDI